MEHYTNCPNKPPPIFPLTMWNGRVAIATMALAVVSLIMRFPTKSKSNVFGPRDKDIFYTLATRHAFEFTLYSLIICKFLQYTLYFIEYLDADKLIWASVEWLLTFEYLLIKMIIKSYCYMKQLFSIKIKNKILN